MRLQSKLLGVLLTAWVLTVAALGLIVHVIVRQQIITGTEEHLERVSYVLQRDLSSFFTERIGDLRVVAGRPGIWNLETSKSQREEVLQRISDAYACYAAIRMVDATGAVLAEVGSVRDLKVPENLRQQSSGLAFHVANQGGRSDAVLWVRAPMGEGLVVADIALERLQAILADPGLALRDSVVRLESGTGVVLFDSSAPSSVGKVATYSMEDVLRRHQSVQDPRTSDTAWSVSVEIPLQRALRPLDDILWVVALSVVIAGLIGGLLIWRLSEALTRPLQTLARSVSGIEEISSSRYQLGHLVHGASEEVVVLHGSIDNLISRLRERVQALHLAQEQLSLALSTTNTGLWDWEPATGRVTFSATWATMLGYQSDEIAPEISSWTSRVHPDDLQETLAVAKAHVEGRTESYRSEHRMLTKDGRWVWILDTGRVVARDAEGKALRMIGTHVDITALKEQEAHLRQAQQAAELAARAKSEFLATMSHEIRTPMNGVIGMTGVLLDMDLTEEQRDVAETIQRSGQALLTVLNDILDVSKMEAGRLELKSQPFAPRRIFQDVVALFRADADAKGLALTGILPPDLPPALITDPNRFRQVLLNLVSNAIKFTERGQVTIRAVAGPVREGCPYGVLHVEIEDQGIGIAAADLPRLFQRFSQIEQGDRRRFGGTGLGLAICKHLVEAMGGTIQVDSTPGVGTRFSFDLPLPPPDTRLPDAYRKVSSVSLPAHLRVLLVEDNAINRKVALMMLKRHGVEIEIAEDGQLGLEAWRRDPRRLILMDCQMPIMDGFEATRCIRAEEAATGGHRTPIIALTASAMEGDRQSCLDVGMDDLLPKPLTPEALAEVLGRWSWKV